jgi:hypothetical protein
MARDALQTDAIPVSGWPAMAPAWLLSLAAHLLLAILGTLLVRATASREKTDETVRPGQIVLARRAENRTDYFADDEAARHEVLKPASGQQAGLTAAGDAGATGADAPPLVTGVSLPQLQGGFPAGNGFVVAPPATGPRGRVRLPVSPLDEAAILAEDALIPREKVATGPTAQLSLFGSSSAEGRSFVFAIDRSNSMGGDGLGALQAAAKELSAHLDRLSDGQTFQVVAYNEAVDYLTERELIPATGDNKRKLVSFIANLAAFGQTEHSRGLLDALRMKPEVIFLLTDGGDPALHPGQLQLIREQAAGRTSIHCIQFGRGPKTARGSFLARLAAENRGSYVYVDMNGQ